MHDLVTSGRISLRMLRYFYQVAISGHFGRAAQELNISKSPMSIQIKELETALGVALFERDSRNVMLTPAGHVLKAECERLFEALDQAITNTQKQGRQEASTLRFGIVSSAFLDGFAEFLEAFKAERPDCTISFTEQSPTQQKEELLAGSIDIGVCRYGDTTNVIDLSAAVLAKHKLGVALPPNHPLKDRRVVSLSELADEKLVVLDRSMTAETQQVLDAFEAAGVNANVAYEVQEPSTMLSLVSSGLAVALISDSFRNMSAASLRFVRLKEDYPGDLCALYANSNKSEVLHAFLQFVALHPLPGIK